jgi:uncharacterized protein
MELKKKLSRKAVIPTKIESNPAKYADTRKYSQVSSKHVSRTNKLLEIKTKIIPILKSHNVAKAGIFGSYARQTQKKSSDVDILVSFKNTYSLFDIIGLKQDLEIALGKKVDLVTYNSLNIKLRERILSEEKKLI